MCVVYLYTQHKFYPLLYYTAHMVLASLFCSHSLLDSRSLSAQGKLDLIGLFKGAKVADLTDNAEFEGKLLFGI